MLKPKLILTIANIMAVSALVSAQTRLIEKVSANGKDIIIPYEKYQLPNGLTLIVHEDHSDPVVHVDVTYHVGSAREELNKSGFAHFFEHMMFQGSENVADEQHFKIISEAGGTLNGSTNRDRTNYYETLPNNQLETALWLEADRMGYFLDSVTSEKFEIQRATVINERGQNYDNRPYGLVPEKTSETLYPYGHPYSWLTIGTIKDIKNTDLNDLKNFFLRWYGPNNAVLTVGGDVNPKEVVKMVEKYFGPIPRGPEVSKMNLEVPVLKADRYIWYEDKVRFPMIQMVFPTVPNYHPDEVALDCLAEILGGGTNSLFYKNFVKNQIAVNAFASHPAFELSGEFTLRVLPFPGKQLSEIEKLIRETLVEFEKRGVTDDDIIRFKAGYESGTIQSLGSVSGKVSQLAAYMTFTGNPNYITKAMKDALAVTKEDVMRVYKTYLKDKKAVILSVVPEGQGNLAASQAKFMADTTVSMFKKEDYRGLKYSKPRDNFDRSKQPASGPNPVITVPPLWKAEFPNGIKLIGSRNDELPTVSIRLTVNGGHQLEANHMDKVGISYLTASLMEESTAKFTSEEIANELEKLGSSISVFSTDENITVTIDCMLKNLDKTLELAEERILKPRFSEEDFDRIRNQQLEFIANQNTQAVAIANKVYNKLLWGPNHIMGIPSIGTIETVKNISLEDVNKFYKDYFSPSVADIVVVGSIDQATIDKKLEFLKRWTGPKVIIPAMAEAPKIDRARIYLVDKEKAPQSEIRIGYLAMPYDAFGEYYKSNLMNYNLGGAFNSRINLNLRENKGWTYGARSGFSGSKSIGPFTASAGVIAKSTDSSIIEFVKEISLFRNEGIKAEELKFMKSAIGQSEARNYETLSQKSGFLRRILYYDLPNDFTKKQNDILQAITSAEINAMAKKYLPMENMHLLVVGSKETVKPGLQKLGYEVIELDLEGNRLPVNRMDNVSIEPQEMPNPNKAELQQSVESVPLDVAEEPVKEKKATDKPKKKKK